MRKWILRATVMVTVFGIAFALVRFSSCIRVSRDRELVGTEDPVILLVQHGALLEEVKAAVARSGTQVDQIVWLGGSLLFHAVDNSRIDIAEWLLRQHANPDGVDVSGVPLEAAIRRENLSMVKLLTDYGANPDIELGHRVTPRKIAESLGNHDILAALPPKIGPTEAAESKHRQTGGPPPNERTSAILEFRIMPNEASENRNPVLRAEEFARLVEDLKKNGPRPEGHATRDYGWFEIDPKFDWHRIEKDRAAKARGMFTATECEGTTYVLLCNSASYVMRLQGKGPAAWHIEQVYSTQDDRGLPALGLTLDGSGDRLLEELTKSNVNNRLAVVLNGRLLCAPQLVVPISGSPVVLVGLFTSTDVERMVKFLRRGAP